jgi:hypothetical protein
MRPILVLLQWKWEKFRFGGRMPSPVWPFDSASHPINSAEGRERPFSIDPRFGYGSAAADLNATAVGWATTGCAKIR